MKNKTPEEIIDNTLLLRGHLEYVGVYDNVIDCMHEFFDQKIAPLISENDSLKGICGGQAIAIEEYKSEAETNLKRIEDLEKLLVNANELIEMAEKGFFGSNGWAINRTEFTERYQQLFPQ